MSRLRLEIQNDQLILELECGLATAPGILKRLIKNQIEPLAQELCPEGLAVAQVVDDIADEISSPKKNG